jgi:hypothetical protein
MKFALALALFLSASWAEAASSIDRVLLANQGNIQSICANDLSRYGSFLEGARSLYRISHRQTREGYPDYDGTQCDQLMRSLNAPASAASCSEAVQTVTGALASCWDNVNRGCTTAVGQHYARLLAQAGRADYSCASRIEIACRQECYPRFPSDCNRSCATLANYAR